MKKMNRLIASLMLVFVLSLSALAGEMDMGITTPPPPGGDTSNSTATTTTAASPVAALVEVLPSVAAGVWQSLP